MNNNIASVHQIQITLYITCNMMFSEQMIMHYKFFNGIRL